jgi:hypothetical protein
MTPTELRDLIFNLHTRKFGNVGEKLIEKVLLELGFVVEEPENTSYDIIVNDKKDEIKCSRVLGKSTLDLENGNILDALKNHVTERHVSLENSCNVTWDCNIQQVKPKYFSTLWYSLFFEDKVIIFKITSNEVIMDDNINYSNKQHRGNEGEGQFHINNKNIKHHLTNYLVKSLTYDEVYDKLNKTK